MGGIASTGFEADKENEKPDEQEGQDGGTEKLRANGINVNSPRDPGGPPPSEPPVIPEASSDSSEPARPPAPKIAAGVEVCHYFNVAGGCRNGENCKYLHFGKPGPEAEKPSDDIETESTATTTAPPGSEIQEKDKSPVEKADPGKIRDSLTFYPGFFGKQECTNIEAWIDDTAARGAQGLLGGAKTLDQTPSRSKYFFGHGYTYGRGMRGKEELLPRGSVAAIPGWVRSCVIAPLERRKIVPAGWVDSVVINDYRAGSSIVAHIDPPKLFARPIITVTFFCPAKLVFGASFDPMRKTPPAYAQMLTRGSVLILNGYAANEVTHGIRPEDLLGARRVSLILRHVIAPQPVSRLPSSFAQNALGLICKAQGVWRSPFSAHSPTRIYAVRCLEVMVLSELRSGMCLEQILQLPDKELQRHPSFHAIWQLVPAEDGIICNGGFLQQDAATSGCLSWRVMLQTSEEIAGEEAEAAVPAPCYRWLRVEN